MTTTRRKFATVPTASHDEFIPFERPVQVRIPAQSLLRSGPQLEQMGIKSATVQVVGVSPDGSWLKVEAQPVRQGIVPKLRRNFVEILDEVAFKEQLSKLNSVQFS